MAKLAQEIETLRQQAAQRATSFYRTVENLAMFDVRVFDALQPFVQDGWEMRGIKPFRAVGVPPPEQKEELQRLKDVVMMDAEQSLIESAEVLMDFGLRRKAINEKLDVTLGPDDDDEEEDQVDEDKGNDEGDGILLVGPGSRPRPRRTMRRGPVKAVIESMFTEKFFTAAKN
jgi:hypothetical protein